MELKNRGQQFIMYSKTYKSTPSTHSSFTPVPHSRNSKDFRTPEPFQSPQPSTADSSISSLFQNFRKDFLEGGLIHSITQTQKQGIATKINTLEAQVNDRVLIMKQIKEGERAVIDYTEVLLQKQNEIITLERRLRGYEESVGRNGDKGTLKNVQKELRQNLNKISAELRAKQNIIRTKNQFIVSEFNHYSKVKQDLIRVKEGFDKVEDKGGLVKLFEGVQVPFAQDFSIDQLIADNPRFRSIPSGETKVKSQIDILLTLIQQSSLSSQSDLEDLLIAFILQIKDSKLQKKLAENSKLMDENELLMTRFKAAAGIWTSQLKDLRRQFPAARIDIDNGITKLLEDSKVTVQLVGNVVQLQSNPIIEVPMAESRTSQLLLSVCKELRRVVSRYPKINQQLSETVSEFLNEGVIDFMEVGNDPSKIIEIVRYLPQQIRVDNVYTLNNDKTKREEFHLRVLIKALLQQLDRLKLKTNSVLQLDQTLIKMIQQQILDVVNIDDILKVFRVNTKIVQVQKVIQKVVERIVEVPQIIPVEKVVERIIEVPKIQQIERVVNVPVEVIKIVDNVVEKVVEIQRIVEVVREVPRIIEKVVEKIVEVPKIVEVERVVERIVVEPQVVEVEKVVNNVVYEIKEVERVVEKIVPVEKIVERMVEVPVYVEKIVEKLVQIPTIVEVEKVVEKVVRDTEVKVVKQNNLEIEVAIEVVDRVVEKIVVVDNYIEKLVEVPKVIEKIVPVKNTETIVKEVEVVREKIVTVYEIKEVERVVNTVVPLVKEVEKVVEVRVEVPFYEEKLVTVPEIITRIEIERVQVPKIIEVQKIVERPIIKNVIVEIQKPIIHYVTDYQIIKQNIEKIIVVPKIVQRIKQVKVQVDKLIEKLVEIPKVVEVEKVIEKVVVIPRVIEKVVEVPQIVETVVERVVEVEKIVEIEKEIEIPVIKEVVVEVEVIKNVYIEVEKIVDRVVEKIVPFETVVERVVQVPHDIERVIPLNKEVPKPIQVEKVVTNIVEVEKVVEIEKPITIPVQVPVQVQRIVEKVVIVENNFEKIVQVPQIIERIVEIHTELVEVEEVERIVERIIPKNVIQTVTEDNVIVQNKVQEVPAVVEKLVPVKEIVREIVEVERIVEKVVERVVEVPKIIEVQRVVQKIVKVPQYIQLQKIVPQLIKVNSIVETIVQKIVSVPLISQVIKSIPTQVQKIIQLKQTCNEIREIEVFRDKIIEVPKLIQIDQVKNIIEKELEIIERFEEVSVPIYSTIEKIIEVPQVLEKIVEKIVMMPQVVEVIKSIHHVPEAVGVGMPQEVSEREDEHRKVANSLKGSLDHLASELRKLRPQHPNLKTCIEAIEKMFVDLQRSVNTNRVVTIPEEVIVQKQVTKPILINAQNLKKDNDTAITLALLSSKLVTEISRIKREHHSVKINLDQDVILTFFPQLSHTGMVNLDFEKQLRSYTDIVLSKFRRLGGWKTDHEMILLNTLQEKFTNTQILKNLNEEIKKVRAQLNSSNSALKPLKQAAGSISQKYKKLEQHLAKLLDTLKQEKINGLSEVSRYFQDFSSFIKQSFHAYKPNPIVRTISTSDKELETVEINRLNSRLRESFGQLENLKTQFIHHSASGPQTPRTFRSEDQLKREIERLQSELSNGGNSVSDRQLRIQFEAKLRDQASFYERQLFEIKGLGSKDQVKYDSQSPYHSTNVTSRLDSSRMESSRIQSSNHRVHTSPSVNGNSSPSRSYGRSMYSSMMQKKL